MPVYLCNVSHVAESGSIGMVVIPGRGQLNRENEIFLFTFAPAYVQRFATSML